jgi:hypothetical protein
MLAFRKRVLTLSVVIGVLAAAYVLGVVFSPASIRRREVEAPLVPRFDAQGVAKIRLTTGQGNVTLEKKGE